MQFHAFLHTSENMKQVIPETTKRTRDEVHTLCLGDEWTKAKELAKEESSSVSCFLRRLINQLHRKKKKEEVGSS